jgi:bacterioferritin-associated ferredoxin
MVEESKEPRNRVIMVVCHCNAVTDKTIRKVVRDGACTRNAVARDCRAGRDCGGCTPVIDEILESERSLAPRSAPALLELAATA